MLEPLDDVQADLTIRDYVCSACWSHLVKYPAPERLWFCKCSQCDDDTPGYVTKFYAESRRGNSMADKADALINLKDLFPRPQRTEQEVLSDLGF